MVLRKLPLEESLQVAEKSNWLKHLNSDEIASLIRRFESKEEIQQLIKEYDIRTYCGSLESVLPPIVYEIKCPYCALHMQEKKKF